MLREIRLNGRAGSATEGTSLMPSAKNVAMAAAPTLPACQRTPPAGDHWQDDVVVLLVKLEHHLKSVKLVRRAVVNGLGGTEKIIGLGGVARQIAVRSYVMAAGLVLEQNSHAELVCATR